MTDLAAPIVEWAESPVANAPLVVLLHGWGESERDMISLSASLPTELTYASVRGPYLEDGRHGWFKIGRSLDDTVTWFERWLDSVAPANRQVVLVGFSAGAAFAGGALLLNPQRYIGAAILFGTLPFDAGLSTPPGRLVGAQVFLAQSPHDGMIPDELLDRTWKYLTEDSGASVHALRQRGGHKISDEVVVDLSRWIRRFTITQLSS